MPAATSISPTLKRACDLSREIIRKRVSLGEVQRRLGTPFEKPDDFAQARHLAHALGSLIQESRLAIYLYDAEADVPETPAEEIKIGRAPDFDLEGPIQWVGRTI